MSDPGSKRPPDDHLPIGRAPFIGRVAERAAVKAAVQRAVREARCEVVTLVGAAGVGKSRFVDELVADLAVDQPMLRAYRGVAREDRGAHAAIATILRSRFALHEGSDSHAQANEVCAQVMDLFGDRRVDEILHFLGVFLGMRFGATLLAEAFLEDPRASEHVARAVLRRRTERVLLRSAAGDPDLAALIHLCERDEVPMVTDAVLTGPYRAVTVIRETT